METKCLLQLLKEKGYIRFTSSMDLDKWHTKEIICEEEIIADKIIDNLSENFEYGDKLYFTRYEEKVYIIHKNGFLETFRKKFMNNEENMRGMLTIPINQHLKHTELLEIIRDNGYKIEYCGINSYGFKIYNVTDIKKKEERIEKENNRKQEIADFIDSLP